MNFLRSFLAIFAGLVVGGFVNMGLVYLGNAIAPPPSGFDMTSRDTIAATAHLLQPINFAVAFFAHALGTLVGAVTAALIAVRNHKAHALIVGVFFLVGGVMAVATIPGPTWFAILDLVAAYIPMAFLGWKLTRR